MFEGAYTAIVTPFNSAGEVDFECYTKLVQRQIDSGIDGIVPVGTTGESPTLNVDEHLRVIETTVELCRNKVKVIAGTGANATAEAVELTTRAAEIGVDGSLQVTPYYNKPNQEGLYRHFSAVADLGLPIVLYNVPGRSARAIDISTVARLAKHPNVAAVKEAGGSVDRVSQIMNACEIEVLSGDDSLTFPMMTVGATGVISVTSNLIPRQVADLVHYALEGQWTEAVALHQSLYSLFNAMFIDTNPIPVKAALAMMGLIEEEYRLPLCTISEDLKARLRRELERMSIL
jgi:4-hydroxy-tetrahydrodipicolinate synthase